MYPKPLDSAPPAEWKAWAEAESAVLALEKARAEQAEAQTPGARAARALAQARADRDASSASEKAARENAVALVPDLSGKTPTKLDTSGAAAIFKAQFSAEAVAQAATAVDRQINSFVDQRSKVLVTGQADLARESIRYDQFDRRVMELTEQVNALLAELNAPVTSGDDDAGDGQFEPQTENVPLVGAVAGEMLGQLISLFSVQRTINATTFADEATRTEFAVVAALDGKVGEVDHEAFRVPPQNDVIDRVEALRDTTQELAKLKQFLELSEAASAETTTAVQNIARVGILVEAVTAFLTAVSAPLEQGSSTMTAASVLAAIVGQRPYYTHVLLVLPATVEVNQVVADRFLKDALWVSASAVITYALFSTASRRVVKVGSAVGTVSGKARLQDSIHLTDPLERSAYGIPEEG